MLIIPSAISAAGVLPKRACRSTALVIICQMLFQRKMDKSGEEEEDQLDEDLPELASLSNRFSYFENFNEHEHKKKRSTTDGGGDEQTTEGDSARRECKAKSVLNKFKEMENRVLNGEDEGKLRSIYTR
jgi:hypothetical protein